MARREDQHRHQLHCVSILPSKTNRYSTQNDRRFARRLSEHERPKALYVDLEDAFEDEETNNDCFGFQSFELNSHPLANDHLQSVETISEVKNSNFSPCVRYQVSRETSQPFNSPAYQPPSNLNRHFTNLNLISSKDRDNNSPAPFTPDAIRLKIKQQETTPRSSSQSKLSLPQYFLVKYLGRTPCAQLWGAKAVRIPIDEMARSAQQLSSMNEIPTLEACVNSHGLILTHRHSPVQNKHHHSRNHSPEQHQQGFIPLDNISYVMHDVKYSKIASCIVVRQLKSNSNDHRNADETLRECFAFLFQSKEYAHRFALALAEAFSVYQQSTRMSRAQHEERREGRSPPRRSKHRNGHHHHRTHNRGNSNDQHLRDSEV